MQLLQLPFPLGDLACSISKGLQVVFLGCLFVFCLVVVFFFLGSLLTLFVLSQYVVGDDAVRRTARLRIWLLTARPRGVAQDHRYSLPSEPNTTLDIPASRVFQTNRIFFFLWSF